MENPFKRIQTIQTPDGPLTVIRPVAAKLLAEGVISGELDGVLRAGDAATLKAAVMAGGVCDFCSAPGTEAVFDVPDFEMPYGAGKSIEGWAACGQCAEMVRTDNRSGLLRRSIAGMSFPKFSKVGIEDLHRRFWAGMDEVKLAQSTAEQVIAFVENALPLWAKPKISERGKRVEAIARVSGLTPAEIEAFVAEKVVSPEATRKLLAWRKKWGKTDPRSLADLLDVPKPPVKPSGVPHWQVALDQKFEIATSLRRFIKATSHEEFFPEGLSHAEMMSPDGQRKIALMTKQAEARKQFKDLGYEQDLKVLPGAQTYSFNEETEAAIMEAMNSFPHDAPLSGIETPNSGSGWFWFSEPLPFAASPVASDHTHGLLWCWVGGERTYNIELNDDLMAKVAPEVRERVMKLEQAGGQGRPLTSRDVAIIGKELRIHGVTQEQFDEMTVEVTEGIPSICFSAYVRDDKGGALPGKVLPSTRWYWPLNLDLHQMLAYNAASWDQTYGPGTPMENDPGIIGRDATLAVVTNLSLFFAQACLWFRQTVEAKQPILLQEKGHIERHARKRYVREYKLTEEPTVQVVALRKSARIPSSEAPADRQAGAREYHCRWIVQGHPRKQPCGPGRKDIKVIWIEAHPAGPPDKPLRTKTKVFAVVR